MKVPAAVLETLRERVSTEGTHLVLTGPRMDSRLYKSVNEVLEAVGGRWTTAVQAHIFPSDAADALAAVLDSGEVVTLREKRQSSQYFPTPASVVERLITLAALEHGMQALEPSAGSGAIADAVRAAGATVHCIERDPGYAGVLTDAGHTVHVADFLTVPPQPDFDRILMNPPFTRGADIQHVEHALRFLKPGGLLVSVMSWAVTTTTRKTAQFRALVEARGGSVEAVPEKAFKESGTAVDTVLVVIPSERPADAKPTAWPARVQPAAEDEPVLQSPAEILRELKANLREAMAEFDALEELLTQPAPIGEPVELPTRRQEQLAFNLTPDERGEAA